MVWRDSIVSPEGYRYFLVILGTVSEVFTHSLPEWFDSNTMGVIYLCPNYYDATDNALYLVSADGPDTSADGWLDNLGYARFVVPTVEHNLAVYYPYAGTATHLAFVRNYLLDKEYQGAVRYAWTIGTQGWNTVYTDTLDCTTSTVLWSYNNGTWSESTATIDSGVWTDNVSVVIENEASGVGASDIQVVTTQGTYYNTEQTFCGSVAPADSTATITVTGSDWVWSDSGEATTPREVTIGNYGTYLLVSSN